MTVRSVSCVFAFVCLAIGGAAPAWAQAEVDQTVDQVAAFGRIVQDMAFNNPNSTRPDVPDFADLGLPGAGPGGFASCKIAPRGLYCLATRTEGADSFQVVRFWKDPTARPGEFKDLLRCDDALLGLQGKQGRYCTGLAVDLSGAIWVTGSPTEGRYKLLKIAQSPATTCGDSLWSAKLGWPASNELCAAAFGSGDGILSDIDVVDGQELAGEPWPFDRGILALRDGIDGAGKPLSEALFFHLHSVTNTPHSFGSWQLGAGERLTSASLLKIPASPPSPARYFVIATSNTRQVVAREATDPAPDAGKTQAFSIQAWEGANPGSATVSLGYDDWASCNGLLSCIRDGATVTASGGSLQTKNYAPGGMTGLGVAGATGGEIDVNERVDVVFPAPRKVSAIQILFLFNGPEYGDPVEQVRITTDGGASFLLKTRAGVDNVADWDGPGSVSPCGRTVQDDSGCFLISDPFPTAVTSLRFEAVDVTASGNDSDFAIGQIETNDYMVRTSPTTGRTYLANRDFQRVLALETTSAAPLLLGVDQSSATGDPFVLSTSPEFADGITVAPGNRIDLTKDCPTPIDATGNGGCVAAYAPDGSPAAKFGAVKLATDSSASGAEVFKVVGMPDCRYVPQACLPLFDLGPMSDDAARAALIDLGVIVPLTTDPVDRLQPAAEQLNIARLLPEDVTSQFDMSGVPPGGYPDPMLVSNLYRGPAANGYFFDGLFFRLEDGLRFAGPFNGEFDVSDLTDGRYELGCEDVFQWDAIVRVPDTRPGPRPGAYVGTLVNVGCRNPTKIITSETSFFPFLEVAPDTYGPTVASRKAVVTLDNDGRFARLLQSLYDDMNTSRLAFVCDAGDGQASPPLGASLCRDLQKYWSSGKQKLDKCVDAAFQPKSSASNENCQAFRNQLGFYKAALPAAPTGPDPGNRLAEQVWRVAVVEYIFEQKFLPSIPANGYCVESNSCPAP